MAQTNIHPGRKLPGDARPRRFHSLAAILLVLCLQATFARAGEVVVVLSSDATPYVQAEAGIRSEFNTAKQGLRTVSFKEVSDRGIEATVGKTADMVIAIGSPAAIGLHKLLPPTIPMVYCMVANPARAGLNEGTPSSGVSTDVPMPEQFKLIAKALPKARTLGILYRSDNVEGQRHIAKVKESLPQGWQLEAVAIDKYDSIAAAIDELLGRRVDAVWTAADSGIYDTTTVRALLLAALRTNTPVFGFSPAFVRAGALLGIGVAPEGQGRQAGALAIRLLRAPADNTIQRTQSPENFEIAVNLIVAEKLSIRLSDDLIQKAAYAFKEDR